MLGVPGEDRTNLSFRTLPLPRQHRAARSPPAEGGEEIHLALIGVPAEVMQLIQIAVKSPNRVQIHEIVDGTGLIGLLAVHPGPPRGIRGFLLDSQTLAREFSGLQGRLYFQGSAMDDLDIGLHHFLIGGLAVFHFALTPPRIKNSCGEIGDEIPIQGVGHEDFVDVEAAITHLRRQVQGWHHPGTGNIDIGIRRQ